MRPQWCPPGMHPPAERAVWKFVVPVGDEVTITGPILTVQSVGTDPLTGLLVVWALVLPDAEPAAHRLYVRGTGHPIGPEVPASGFIGTAVDQRTGLVWHVFYGGRADT